MKIQSGRIMSVGINPNQGLPFRFAGLQAVDMSGEGFTTTTTYDTAGINAANAWINSGGTDSSVGVDTATGLPLYVRSPSNPNPPKTGSSFSAYLPLALGALAFIILIKAVGK